MPTSRPTRGNVTPLLSQTAASRQLGGTPRQSQPKGGRRFTSQPSQRPTRRYDPTATATSTPHTSRLFTSVSVGHTACGTRFDGSIECWGSDNDGSQPPEGEFTTVDVNGYHACGHLTSGMVECWGSDHNKRPMVRAPDGEFASVSAGWSHACGVRPNMSIECWGRNYSGETYPPIGTFASVSAGAFFSCGLRADDSLVCWGSNQSGKSSPPAGEFSYVGTGWDHACALGTSCTSQGRC